MVKPLWLSPWSTLKETHLDSRVPWLLRERRGQGDLQQEQLPQACEAERRGQEGPEPAGRDGFAEQAVGLGRDAAPLCFRDQQETVHGGPT